MFLTLLLGLGAAGLGAFGVKKGFDAISDNKEARETNDDAQDIINSAKKKLSRARSASKKALENLGQQKYHMYEQPLSNFIRLFEQIKNVKLDDCPSLNELSDFSIDKQNFATLKADTELMSSFAGGTVSGLTAGAAVAFGAYGAASALATASTGTAIATLSGAAATNATLAFFGGGALAAGGLGIAGGTAILGGVVAGPALAICGAIMSSKAKANLDRAYSNLAEAEETEAQVNVLVSACNGIRKMASQFQRLLIKLDLLLAEALENFDRIIQQEGTDYRTYSQSSKNGVAALVALVQATKALLDTPIINKKGAVTKKSAQIAKAVQLQLSA